MRLPESWPPTPRSITPRFRPRADQAGGLSGRPLREKSTAFVRLISERTRLPIIAVGGIDDAQTAREKFDAGAALVQVYTGYIYRGPGLVREIVTDVAMPSVGVTRAMQSRVHGDRARRYNAQIRNSPRSMIWSPSNQMSKFRPTQSMCVVETQFCPVCSA